jgi:hypothetical protein
MDLTERGNELFEHPKGLGKIWKGSHYFPDDLR